MAKIFDGRAFAAEKEVSLQNRVIGLKSRGIHPKLASVIVGNDPASKLYVGLKKKAAERIGAELDIYFLTERTKLSEILVLIGSLNVDDTVQGIMIQMPLPEGEMLNSKSEILNAISPEKDVDGLKPDSHYLHPTSKAVIQIIEEAKKEDLSNNLFKKVVVVGSTGMVGKPLVAELKTEKYEVIECNTKTTNLKEKTLQADILVSTTGVPGIITADMVKPGAVVIDVGSPKGDVDFPKVEKVAGFISPVPGGVGPVTITCLLENLISAC